MSCDKSIGGIIIGVVVLMAGTYFIPWQSVQWGRLSVAPVKTVTVVGTAETQITNEVAEFNAGVEATGDKKDEVVNQVNSEAGRIVAALKEFGIVEADIKTQNMSVYQQQESYYDSAAGSQKTRPGQWSASNSVQIVLRDTKQVDALASLLSNTGATNVYGPNFRLDDQNSVGDKLLSKALDNANAKAEGLAREQGLILDKIISITEGSASSISPMRFDGLGAGGGGGVMPGSSSVSNSVTVVYELR